MPDARPRLLGWGWLLSLLYSTLLGVLIFVSTLLMAGGNSPAPVAAPTGLQPNWAADFPSRIDHVTASLTALPLALPTPIEQRQGSGTVRWTHRRYELTIPEPQDFAATERLFDPVRSAAAGVTVEIKRHQAGAQVQIGVDGLLTHTLALHWLGRRPRAAIIVGDLGNDLFTARELAGIDAPITFAVMPFRPFSQQVAELATLFGREVLLQLPTVAETGDGQNGEQVLAVTAARPDIVSTLDASLADVPHHVGVNGAGAARLSADQEHRILERLKEESLFLIDSRPPPQAAACQAAATAHLACGSPSLFLDDTDEEGAIAAQLDRLVELARTRGDAIAVGHARTATINALHAALPQFAARGVDLAPASTLVMAESLSHR